MKVSSPHEPWSFPHPFHMLLPPSSPTSSSPGLWHQVSQGQYNLPGKAKCFLPFGDKDWLPAGIYVLEFKELEQLLLLQPRVGVNLEWVECPWKML